MDGFGPGGIRTRVRSVPLEGVYVCSRALGRGDHSIRAHVSVTGARPRRPAPTPGLRLPGIPPFGLQGRGGPALTRLARRRTPQRCRWQLWVCLIVFTGTIWPSPDTQPVLTHLRRNQNRAHSGRGETLRRHDSYTTLAEGQGFEPWRPLDPHTFQACSSNQPDPFLGTARGIRTLNLLVLNQAPLPLGQSGKEPVQFSRTRNDESPHQAGWRGLSRVFLRDLGLAGPLQGAIHRNPAKVAGHQDGAGKQASHED